MEAEFGIIRNGWDKAELLEPGKIERYTLAMYFNGYVFKAGYRVRIEVTSSNYLELFPNTNAGIDPYTDPKPIVAQNRINHDGQYPSHAKLPVRYGL